jgi:chloramphenicol-sensitive protein RarD
MTETAKGIAAAIAAASIWGLSSLFYKALADVPPLEILSHRALWSLVFFCTVLAFQRRLHEIPRAFATRRAGLLIILASLMIAINWFMFIWAIQIGQATQSSLGYYIFPLVAVFLGRLALNERLTPVQWLSVGLAGFAVTVLTLGQGAAPWIALCLAFTFGLYGLFKKQLDLGPVVSVTAEVLLVAPFALLLLLQIYLGGGAAFGADLFETALLILAGPLTAVPLILFSYAARRLTMATTGLLLYINPTLQFAVAVCIFAEPFGLWHLTAFAMIWTALGIYSFSALAREKARRKASSAHPASGAIV